MDLRRRVLTNLMEDEDMGKNFISIYNAYSQSKLYLGTEIIDLNSLESVIFIPNSSYNEIISDTPSSEFTGFKTYYPCLRQGSVYGDWLTNSGSSQIERLRLGDTPSIIGDYNSSLIINKDTYEYETYPSGAFRDKNGDLNAFIGYWEYKQIGSYAYMDIKSVSMYRIDENLNILNEVLTIPISTKYPSEYINILKVTEDYIYYVTYGDSRVHIFSINRYNINTGEDVVVKDAPSTHEYVKYTYINIITL